MKTSKNTAVSALAALALCAGAVTAEARPASTAATHPAKAAAPSPKLATSSRVVVGKVARLNALRHTLIVKAHAYAYSPKALGGTVKALRAGETVKIVYRTWRGHRTALKIEPMKA